MMAGSKQAVDDLPATDERGGPEERDEERDRARLAAVVVKRRKLELARTDVLHQLERARADAHREMLNRALHALDQELERLV